MLLVLLNEMQHALLLRVCRLDTSLVCPKLALV